MAIKSVGNDFYTVDTPTTVYGQQGEERLIEPGQQFVSPYWSETKPGSSLAMNNNPATNALVNGVTNPIAALSPASTTQPDFATSLALYQETPEQRAARYGLVDENLRRQQAEILQRGEAMKGSVAGRFQKGSRTGTGYDSIRDTEIRAVQKDIEKSIKEAQDAAAAAKVNGDINAENLALKKLELASNLKSQADNAALNQMKLKLDALTTNFNIMKDIPQGQSITIGDSTFTGLAQPDPIFTGSNIVEMMKTLPIGQSRQVTDPVSGAVYTIEGMASSDPNYKQFTSVNDKGDYSIINFDPATNKVVGQIQIKGVGKTGGSAPSVTLTLNQQQQGDLQSAITRLEGTKEPNGYFNIDKVKEELSDFSAKNPGKYNYLLDVVKNFLDPNDPVARQIITGTYKPQEKVIITTPSGSKMEINK